MKYVLIDNYKFTPVVHRETGDLTNIIKITYLDGPKVEISGAVDESYEVNFVNADTDEIVYSSTIGIGMWCASAIRYFVNWKIVVKRDGVVVKEDVLSLKDKRVKIILDTQSMGDLISYVGAVDAFQKKHGCSVDCVLYSKILFDIFKNSYPNIKFIATNDDTGIIYHAAYTLGWFDEWKGRAPNNPQTISLAHNAGDILGLGLVEFKPTLKFDRTKKHTSKKYVCIAIQSTAQYKYWNNRGGWEKVIAYLKTLGYEVWCIDRDSSFGSKTHMNVIPKGAVNKTGNLPLSTRMEQINGAEFFIGISSGLSWLAWAVGVPVILVSGMSQDWLEFRTPYRVINKNVCHGCCNDTNHKFDKSNWLFCPRNKNFECTTQIPPEMVCREIDKLTHNNRNKVVNGFVWEPHVTQQQKEFMYEDIFVYNTYEKVFPVEDGDVVVDLGAHVGLFSYFASRNKLKKLVAVEPSRNRSAALRKNLDKFPVHVIEKGVAKDDGFVKDGLVFDGITEGLPTVSLSTILTEAGIEQIDFLKIDVEGAEYEIFTEENLGWITANVKKIAGEWHMETPDRREKFIKFRDTVLTKLTNYHIFSVDHVDIKWNLFHEDFLSKYHEIMIHIDNRDTFKPKSSEFDVNTFLEKYKEYVEPNGPSRYKFYTHVIPKLVAKGKPLNILETGAMWLPLKDNSGAFTLIMADLIKNHTGGRLYTVDVSEKSISECKTHTKEFSDVIEYVCSDSIAYLGSLTKEFVETLDLIYLDSMDFCVPSPHNSAQHHLNELTVLYPNIGQKCGIAIDDNFLPGTYVTWETYNNDGSVRTVERYETGNKILGKGMYCNEFLLSRGWNRFDEIDVMGGSNVFYYENPKYSLEQVKSILKCFYEKYEIAKPETDKFLARDKITNRPGGLGDALILSNLAAHKKVCSTFPQFDDLMKYNEHYKSVDNSGAFDLDTSDWRKYDWHGGHCTQQLEKAFLGKCSLVPKPAIFKRLNATKKKVGLHLSTTTPSGKINNLNPETVAEIKMFLVNDGYTVTDCGNIDDITSLVDELATCEYFLGIDSGPMHVAAALGLKSVVILNREDSNQIYLPKCSDVDIPNSEWLYPQNVHLSMKNRNALIEKFSISALKSALNGQLYPYFSTEYVREFEDVLQEWKFEESTGKLSFALKREVNNPTLVLKDLTTGLVCYHWELERFEKNGWYYIIPSETIKYTEFNFSGVVFDLYECGKHIYSKDLTTNTSTKPSIRFYSDEATDLTIKDRFYTQYLDFYNNSFLNDIVNDGDTIVDVGASCGTFTQACLRKNVKKIVCLEPSPSFSILNKTFDDRVRCLKVALATTNEMKEFYFTDQTTLNTFNIGDQLKYDTGNYVKDYVKTPVKCMTLESVLNTENLAVVDLLKIDIEGYEHELFDTINPDTLLPIKQILMEFHHNEHGKVRRITDKLASAGFNVNFLDLKYKFMDSSNSLQGVVYASRNSKASTYPKYQVKFIGGTDDNLGIKYSTDVDNKRINIKIVDTFTGLTFHDESMTIGNSCTYFTKHAYLLPNQSFRIYDTVTGKLMLEKIINTHLDWPVDSFDEANRNLVWLIPNNLKASRILGFSYLEIFHRKTYGYKCYTVNPGDVVVDLGANCGLFSRYAFQHGAKSVYAIEPNALLEPCYKNLNSGKDYMLVNKAVYSKQVSFHQDPSADLGAAVVDYDPVLGDVSVDFNDFVKEHGISKIDYLKVDIEGAEYDLFETIDEQFLKNCVTKVVIEYHHNTDGKKVEPILNVLRRCGFSWEFENDGGEKSELGMLYAIK